MATLSRVRVREFASSRCRHQTPRGIANPGARIEFVPGIDRLVPRAAPILGAAGRCQRPILLMAEFRVIAAIAPLVLMVVTVLIVIVVAFPGFLDHASGCQRK
jgi:hypothetical protein